MILSPMATGNGAYVVHRALEQEIKDYCVFPYNPYWTLFPPALHLFCRDKRPSIVHTTPDYGLFFRRKGIPLVLTVHNFVLDRFMQQYSTWPQRIHYKTDLRWFTGASLALADVVTSVSHYTASLVRKELGYRRDIRVIYNGIDTKRFAPATKSGKKHITVLFSGNVSLRKGANLLPLIAEKLNPGISIIYTKGLRTRHSLVYRSNLRDAGHIPYRDMPRLYQDADMLLLPTVREGFCLAALEAMASGLPVITTNCSSMPEMIEHNKGGFLCNPEDTDEFADKINLLADSPHLRRDMGSCNRERIERHFSQELMIGRYQELFEEILK